MTFSLVESGVTGVAFRGAAGDLWRCKRHEVILSGPAETGKTFAALHKLDALMWRYSHAQAAIVRKTYKSTVSSVIQTYVNKVLAPGAGIIPYGGERPDWFDYPNGSRVWVAGMDSADKVLSSERDFIYVNQAEELSVDDWETLGTRCTGRAGNTPYAQLFGDCNPASRNHWIVERAKVGTLSLLKSEHRDNPMLYDEAGGLTAQGTRTMETLEALTGSRRKRLYEGEWFSAEGLVYEEFSREVHVCERPREDLRHFIVGCDEGYTNPSVALVIGVDGDGRAHVIEEFYQRRVLQAAFVDVCRDIYQRYHPDAFYVDPSAAGLIAEMQSAGLPALGGTNDVSDGIQAVKQRFVVQGDGRPRLTINADCVNLISEMEAYVWAHGRDGTALDKPGKDDDHAEDALRYAVSALAGALDGQLFY